MTVEVRLFAGLARYITGAGNGEPIEVSLIEPSTVSDLLGQLNIPEKEAFLTIVNGMALPHSTVLENGDRVGIFPAIGGG